MNKKYLLISLAGCALIGLSFVTSKKLIFNVTESVPIGLYWVQDLENVHKGSLIVFRLNNAWLIKEVAGIHGDLFCVNAEGDFKVNDRVLGKARTTDSHGKPLKRVGGCQKIAAEEWVVRGYGERSFDSRYFGTVKRRDVLCKAIPIGEKILERMRKAR